MKSIRMRYALAFSVGVVVAWGFGSLTRGGVAAQESEGSEAEVASSEDERFFMFNALWFKPDGGAKATATGKLMESIEMWRRKKGYKRVRIGKVKIRCDPWTMVYILPHHRCYARARVCR